MKKEDFYGSKWDARDWTEEQKIKWQNKCFELGFSWHGKTEVFGLNSNFFWMDGTNYLYLDANDYEYFLTESSEEKHYEDMFPEQPEEKLDVVAEIVKLVHESQSVEVEEEEDSFDGLVYIAPEEGQSPYKYFAILRETCSDAQWDYILKNCPMDSSGVTGKETSLQICSDDPEWFDNHVIDSDDIIVSFNNIFQYKEV